MRTLKLGLPSEPPLPPVPAAATADADFLRYVPVASDCWMLELCAGYGIPATALALGGCCCDT